MPWLPLNLCNGRVRKNRFSWEFILLLFYLQWYSAQQMVPYASFFYQSTILFKIFLLSLTAIFVPISILLLYMLYRGFFSKIQFRKFNIAASPLQYGHPHQINCLSFQYIYQGLLFLFHSCVHSQNNTALLRTRNNVVGAWKLMLCIKLWNVHITQVVLNSKS